MIEILLVVIVLELAWQIHRDEMRLMMNGRAWPWRVAFWIGYRRRERKRRREGL